MNRFSIFLYLNIYTLNFRGGHNSNFLQMYCIFAKFIYNCYSSSASTIPWAKEWPTTCLTTGVHWPTSMMCGKEERDCRPYAWKEDQNLRSCHHWDWDEASSPERLRWTEPNNFAFKHEVCTKNHARSNILRLTDIGRLAALTDPICRPPFRKCRTWVKYTTSYLLFAPHRMIAAWFSVMR